MGNMWEDTDTSAFELPGDAERIAEIAPESAAAEQPEPTEAEPTISGTVKMEGDERPRDEKGRFVSPEEAGAETDVTVSEPEYPEKVRSLLARYGGDIGKALEGATEAQSHIGSLNQELGTLRERAALADRYEQYFQQAQQPGSEDWEQALQERPAEAAKQAFTYGQQSGDWRRWYKAAEVWDEVVPGAPDLWLQNMQMMAQNEQLSRAYHDQILGQTIAEVAERVGGLDESLAELAPQYPTLFKALADPGVSAEEKGKALEALAYIKRGLDTGTLAERARQAARDAAEAEQQAVSDAAVVTATRTVPQEAKKSTAERISEEWFEDERRWNEGWNLS